MPAVSMPRALRTPDDLRRASVEIWYEYSMFCQLAKGLASGVLGEGPIRNAALEAFLLHTRALTEFFYQASPRSDDIVAQDFMSVSVTWMGICPPISPALEKLRHRAGKHLAHLTYDRLEVKPETKPWPFLEILSGVAAPLQVFLLHASKEVLADDWFDKLQV
ncbi:hypothetical protein [Nitrosomonas sp.]|uniref:hypothetical protein n=1 Tax=Nitrosomonas sp. TaxID=42353 RepID=UPI0026009014|nr:hypothetical protein [Nitrosomonas sp.]MBY0484225.1 hypothetical protein [Nitrosomonas sp.]